LLQFKDFKETVTCSDTQTECNPSQGQSDPILVHDTLSIVLMHTCTKYHSGRPFNDISYAQDKCVKQKSKNLTLDSKVKVTVPSFWYATLRLVLMHIHACSKYHGGSPLDKYI